MQVLSFWSALDMRRRIIVVLATAAAFAAVLGVARMASAPSWALLYAGLDPAAAGEVVSALAARGAAHEVRGDAIYVEAAARDALRMALAGDGLPAGGPAGYELLDSLSGFATTAQMFDAAYLRAKEGELARTIAASPHVRAARVHIALPATRQFRRDQRATAAVTVTSAAGSLPPGQARAVRHLVAAAVAGLAPEDVTVVDSVSGLALDPADDPGAGPGTDARAADLRGALERLLAARVGAGHVLVEVSIDAATEREVVVERRFDPQGRVAISSETEERSDSASGSEQGVTVASNLPDGDAAGTGDRQSRSSQTRERVNYEVSETKREVERLPGQIRRISVAVLVDGVRAADGTWSPREAAELADLEALAAAAAGLDTARGDTILVRSMQFEPVAEAGTLAQASMLGRLDPMRLAQLGIAALVALVLGLFVLRPILLSSRRPLPRAALALDGPRGGAPGLPAGEALTGENDDAPGGGGGALPAQRRAGAEAPGPDDAGAADPVERLRRMIAERQAESIEILRQWTEDRG
jgi:flagellar M-ring protein FliF